MTKQIKHIRRSKYGRKFSAGRLLHRYPKNIKTIPVDYIGDLKKGDLVLIRIPRWRLIEKDDATPREFFFKFQNRIGKVEKYSFGVYEIRFGRDVRPFANFELRKVIV